MCDVGTLGCAQNFYLECNKCTKCVLSPVEVKLVLGNLLSKSRASNLLATFHTTMARPLHTGQNRATMKTLMDDLLALQHLESQNRQRLPDQEEQIRGLREKIPNRILDHYDRLMARGKRGLAAIRNQSCSGCHMRVPVGTIATMMRGTDIQRCENCGRYLYLPEDEPVYSGRSAVNSKPAVSKPE